MKFSHKLALAATTLGLVAATAAPAFVNAQTATTDQTNPRTSLIQALIQRFHLSQTDLEQFFQEQEQQYLTQHQAKAQTRLEERLTQDVSAGSLTEAQKSALLAKAKEAQAKHAAARKLSREECKKIMDQYRTELETWLSQQGIDRSYLPDIMGMGPGPIGGFGGPNGPGMMGPPEDGHDGSQALGPQGSETQDQGTSGRIGQNFQGRRPARPNGMRRGGPMGFFGGQNQNGPTTPGTQQ